MSLEAFFKHASFDDGLKLIASYDHEKHAGDWDAALTDYLEKHADASLRNALIGAGTGAALGTGLGYLSSDQDERARKQRGNRMLTGGLLGALGGGGLGMGYAAAFGEGGILPQVQSGTDRVAGEGEKDPAITRAAATASSLFKPIAQAVSPDHSAGTPLLTGLGVGGTSYLANRNQWFGDKTIAERIFPRLAERTQARGINRALADRTIASEGFNKSLDKLLGKFTQSTDALKRPTSSSEMAKWISRFGTQAPAAHELYHRKRVPDTSNWKTLWGRAPIMERFTPSGKKLREQSTLAKAHGPGRAPAKALAKKLRRRQNESRNAGAYFRRSSAGLGAAPKLPTTLAPRAIKGFEGLASEASRLGRARGLGPIISKGVVPGLLASWITSRLTGGAEAQERVANMWKTQQGQ